MNVDFFQVASYGDWLIGAERSSGRIEIREINNMGIKVHSIPAIFQQVFMRSCMSRSKIVCTFNRVFVIVENFLIFISDEDSIITVDLDEGFNMLYTLIENASHFSLNKNVMSVISSDRMVTRYKINDGFKPETIKSNPIYQSKTYEFHTICRIW